MRPLSIQKMGVSFGLLSLGVLFIGSILMGATVLTAIIRGIAGAIIFGLLAWFSGSLLIREDKIVESEDHKKDPNKGTQLNQTA